jgi:DSF synthase
MSIRSNAVLAQVTHELTGANDESVQFAISNELTCHFDAGKQTLWTRMTPRNIPCFTARLLHDMERGSQLIESHFASHADNQALGYIVLQSGIPRVFNLGGDFGQFLQLIAAEDRDGLMDYAHMAVNVVHRNYTSHNLPGVTTIALMEGDALGGGFECALSCDIVIAERQVKCGFPEVLFDMFPGMGALSFLARRCPRNIVQKLTRTGRQYTADELHEMGVVDVVAEPGGGVEAAKQLIARRHGQKKGHDAMNAIDRMLYPITLKELSDIVDIWVTSALTLSSRGQEWMRRLHMQQLRAFGGMSAGSGSVLRPVPTSN